MRLQKDDQIFNLFDTNGRRNDILNAYKIYAGILDKLKISKNNPWQSYPKSLVQYDFYKQAITLSADHFKVHPSFDAFEAKLKDDPDFRHKFESKSLDRGEDPQYAEQLTSLDKDIEARARHYTNSLVRIGFATAERELTPAGRALLNPSSIELDPLEQVLGLQNDNLLILRQLLKLRIFNSEGTRYYSPGKFALYLILRGYRDRAIYTVPNFMKLVQLVSPAGEYDIDDVDESLERLGYERTLLLLTSDADSLDGEEMSAADRLGDNEIPERMFDRVFENLKSRAMIRTYRDFYLSLCDFIQRKDDASLSRLRDVFDNQTDNNALKKAFGQGRTIFKFGNRKLTVEQFLEANKQNPLLDCRDLRELNKAFYGAFVESKASDRLRENKNETQYLLEATGLFHTDDEVSLNIPKDLFDSTEILENLRDDILHEGSFSDYESGPGSPFGRMMSLSDILDLDYEQAAHRVDSVVKELDLKDATELGQHYNDEREQKFRNMVRSDFPREKVFRILKQFEDRSNDHDIQREVTVEADVPTIFEYISGLAWYYLSDDKNYRLLSSFNLTLDANFKPLTHASGGEGDIVIRYRNITLMLEVTLMNEQAQKRGEWEPVLRHSVNLTISSDKPTITFFLANELDYNTINIWRAVASVPLESSTGSGEITRDGVRIMPLQIEDFIEFNANPRFSSRKLLKAVDDSFQELVSQKFDDSWRRRIIEASVR